VRYGVWRAGVATVTVLALAAQAAWLAGRFEDMLLAAFGALVALDLALLGAAAGALRLPPVELRWDTQRWHIVRASSPDEPGPGRLTIALDLGAWMLLRFDHEPSAAPGAARRTTWLPVQRRGLEARWHALRCALYCARPAAAPGTGTDTGPRSHAGRETQE
jgi:hypothetical protein